MKIVFIFILGLAILLGAVLLNFIATRVGLITWYDFLKSPSKTDILSYLWLFIIYPLGLGIIAYYIAKILNI